MVLLVLLEQRSKKDYCKSENRALNPIKVPIKAAESICIIVFESKDYLYSAAMVDVTPEMVRN